VHKTEFVGNAMIVVGFLALAGALLVFLWPLGFGIAALFAASRLLSIFKGKKREAGRESYADHYQPPSGAGER
jgi:hypothetical protein